MGRKKTPPVNPVNLALKVAIVSTGQTQRRFALRIGLSELRLSEIIHNRGPISAIEKAKLARGLKCRIEALFPEIEPVTATGTR